VRNVANWATFWWLVAFPKIIMIIIKIIIFVKRQKVVTSEALTTACAHFLTTRMTCRHVTLGGAYIGYFLHVVGDLKSKSLVTLDAMGGLDGRPAQTDLT